jgi:glyoxylase-like metal-dependent hydrolase (beta-lactamase superfamily II)
MAGHLTALPEARAKVAALFNPAFRFQEDAMRKSFSAAPRALAIAGALALAAIPAVAQQQDFSKVQVKSIPVAGKIHMLTGAGGNIGVSVGSDGLLIVDDQYAPLADRIRAALKLLGGGSLKFVLNTHWHGDHTGGNAAFGPEAPIIAHANVRKRLSAEQHVMGTTVAASPEKAWPVITFDDAIAVHFNGEEIRVVHFAHGHTDGDSVIFFTGAHVVHMGDDFFNGMFPFVDLSSGGSVQGMAAAVSAVIPMIPADAKVIPGHGPLSDVNGLKTFSRMLETSLDTVRQGIAAHKSLAEIQKAGLPAEWKSWPSSFVTTDFWIETVYKSLTEGKGNG